jgi:hypothetical protein
MARISDTHINATFHVTKLDANGNAIADMSTFKGCMDMAITTANDDDLLISSGIRSPVIRSSSASVVLSGAESRNMGPLFGYGDAHPDPLIINGDYLERQPGWFSLTAFGQSYYAWNEGEQRALFSTRVMVSDTEGYDNMKIRYQHPSREYLEEIARQLIIGERYLFLDPREGGAPCIAVHVTLWEHDNDGIAVHQRRTFTPPAPPRHPLEEPPHV